MNILIPWKPSKWQEIVFCIRSIRRNYQDLAEIIIISESNPEIPDTLHFPYPDITAAEASDYRLREQHINQKIISCAAQSGLKEFIVQGDDQYWLKPINDDFFRQPQPWLNHATIEQINNRKTQLLKVKQGYWHWEHCLIDTLLCLEKNNQPYINYTAHMPIHLSIEELETARDFFGGWSFQLESGVYNLSQRKTGLQIETGKLRKGVYDKETDLSDIDEYLFLSHDDKGLSHHLKDFIISRFYV
ncbi:MAG: hypothetical protein KZQ83_07105 [gamma proteobacterium symbiont of Taylorina sp.]|nr:hypothetical protein [gamma proteobacterium symbiont of Taylorina sp.]